MNAARPIAILLLCSSLACAENWPEFRGPTGQGLSTAKGVPTKWSESEHVVWKQKIPGKGWSSPVLVDGRIYLTTGVPLDSTSSGVSLRVMCVDAASGGILWNVEVLQATANDAKAMHEKNSVASPTPIVSNGRIFVHFGHMGTAALDVAGNIAWRQTELKYAPQNGNGGSPVLVGDLLVYGCDGIADPFLVALGQADGKVLWKTPREKMKVGQLFTFSTPLVIDVKGEKQIVSQASGFVGAYDPRDGHEIWRVRYGDGFSVVPRPVFAHGLLYVCTGYGKASLLAIDPVGARGDATETNVRWKTDRSVSLTPSPLVVGDELYFVSDNGVATCLDAHTGTQNWTQRLGGAFSASPVHADGNVYFLNEAGVTSIVKTGTKYELVATNDLGERALASPAVDNGVIFLRTESTLWRVGN